MTSTRVTGWALATALTALMSFLGGLPAIARAQAPTLEERVAEFVRERAYDSGGSGVSIDVPPIPMSQAERATLDADLSMNPRQAVSGRVPVRISLRRDREPVRSLVVAVDVASTRPVLVASRAIRPGEAVSHDAVELQQRDARRLPRDAIAEVAQLRGLRARRAVAPGSVLRSSGLEAVTDVQRGQRVKLVLRTRGLRIESVGRAREDGNVGDWIEAQNWASKRSVIGRVGADGALHVSP
jgi:flagella basal body P-ring formation protein FlgA